MDQQTVLSAPIGPVNHIFPESVLRLILDFSIEGPVSLPPPRDDQRRVFTQVCREWREIVVNTPTYWDSFNFVQRRGEPSDDLFRLAECFFRRSKDTHPLSVDFGSSLQSDIGRNIFELVLRPRAHRVQFLSCSVTKKTLRILFGYDPVHFPLLQAIDVAVICDLNGTIASRMPLRDSIDLSGFHRAPRLRDVNLRIIDGVHPADLKLPWGQLTRLDLSHTCIQVPTFMEVMKESVLLEDGVFCVSFARYYDGQPTRLRRISVPHLRSLRLRLFQPSEDARIFESLHIPLLEVLWVEREEEAGHAIRDMTIYETLLAGLNGNIKHLTIAENAIPMTWWFIPRLIRSSRITYQHLDGTFRLCNTLTSLFLCAGVFIEPLVVEKIATGEFLPLLEQLGVNSVHGWDIIWMVQKKNFASTFPDSGPSLSPAVRSIRPVALIYLRLCTMGGGLSEADKQELEDAATALHLACGYLMRHIDITGGSNLI